MVKAPVKKTIERSGAPLYYEMHGDGGPAVLLCNGIGFSSWSWYRQIPELAREFRVVTFDNRGSGGSPWNGNPFTMADLADDGAAVLDDLGFSRAHLVGISMGGFVAQELALRHPRRFLTLTLGCTHCGAPQARFMEAEVALKMTALAERGWTEESVTNTLELNFSPDFLARPENHSFIRDYVAQRVENAPDSQGWLAQREGSLKFSSFSRLAQIQTPTHILQGDGDAVVPPENAHILQKAIPGARLRILSGARHAFFLERADEVNSFFSTLFKSISVR